MGVTVKHHVAEVIFRRGTVMQTSEIFHISQGARDDR